MLDSPDNSQFLIIFYFFFFFKQKTAYEMRISDWSSDVCSSDIASSRSRSPWITAFACTISVYSRACGASSRWNTRQWVSVQSIIGATDRRNDAAPGCGLGGGWPGTDLDRKSVVAGKRGSGRVDLGGRGLLNKKKKTNHT